MMAGWTIHQGRATKNKKTVGVTFVRDPLLGAEPCHSPDMSRIVS